MVDAFLSNFYIWKKIVFNQNATLWKQTGFLYRFLDIIQKISGRFLIDKLHYHITNDLI